MTGFERQDSTVKVSPDGSQQQTVTKRAPLMNQESPSTIRYLVENSEYIQELALQLAGWSQIPVIPQEVSGQDVSTRMEWRQIGKPLINDKGRGWLLSQLSSVLNKNLRLSNFPEWRMRDILSSEFDNAKRHLAMHMKVYELGVEDVDTVMMFYRRAVEASYRRSVNDRGAKHVFGSFDESVGITTQREPRKMFGLIPY